MSTKFKVKPKFRTNDLANHAASRVAEVHYRNNEIRIYDNIHYPKSFCKKIFEGESSSLVSHIVIKDNSDQSVETVYNPTNGVQ
jgi:hypothetical protein